jgi:hypothetical protein
MNCHSSQARNEVERAELEPSFGVRVKNAGFQLGAMRSASLGWNDDFVWKSV